MKKIFVSFLLMAGLGLITASSSFATVTITNANATISADTAGGAYTTLTGPVIVEGAHQDIGAGTIILSAPAGFQFNPAATVMVTTSRVFGTLALITLSTETATVTSSNITITVVAPDGGSTTETALTWSGIQVRPIAGTPLATNNMIMATASTATISGVTKGSTNFGTLGESAGAGKKLVYTTSPPLTNAAGSAITSFVVQLQDQFGNAISSNNVPVFVALNTGSFASGTTNVNTGAGGSATFSNLTIHTVGSYTITASGTSTNLTATPASALTVIPGAASVVSFVQGPPAPATAGATFTPAVTVKVTDAFANVITNKTVTMGLIGAGTLNGTLSQATVGTGIATFGDLSINQAGTNKFLTASITSPSLIATGSSFNVNAATGTKLVYTTAPAATNTASAIMASVVVQIQDQFNNPVPSNGVPITVALNAGAFDSGTVTVNTGAGGSATFNNLVINTAGSYTLTASADSLTSTTPSSFTVIPAAANIITFIQSPPSTATAGVAFSPAVTVKVTDAFNNAITNKAVAMGLSGGGALNGTLSQATATGGIATFSNLSINTAGTNYALIASTTSPSLSTTSTPPFTVVAAAPTKLVYTTAPASTNTAGTTMASVVVQVEDSLGNKVSSNNVSITVALNTGTFASGTTTIATDAGGAATFSDLVINAAGNYTLTASGAPFTATPASAFKVIPATASSVAFVQEPPVNVTAGATFSPAVTVKVVDQFNNVISNKTVAMTLNGGGTLNGTASQNTAGSGVATFGNLSVNQPGSNKTLTASITSPALSATSTEFTVNIGAIDHYVVSVVGAPTRATVFNVAVTAQDVASNTVVADSSTIVTMAGTGSMQFDSNGDSTYGDNTKQLSSGTSTISAMDIYGETVTITATDGNGKTGSTSVTVNAASGDYRSNVSSGNWSTAASWQTWNGSSWVTAGTPPSGSAGINITIQSGQTITVTSGTGNLNLLGTLLTQGTLSFSGGTITVGSGGVLRNSGTVNGSTSTLVFNSGGTYQHNYTTVTGTIPTATWNTNSTCAFIGYTTLDNSSGSTSIGGLTQTFGNFTWNCPDESGTITFIGALNNVAGNFTISSTGSGLLRLGNNAAGNLSVGGNFLQTQGSFQITAASNRTVTVSGDFSLSGGIFDLTASGSGTLNVAKNFSHTGGTLTETDASAPSAAVVFNGTGTQFYTSGGTVSGTINFTINSGATLMMGTNLLGNGSSGTFTLLAGGTLGIGDPLGITTSGASGNIRVTGTRSYNIGASYIYNGPASQVTSNGLPATVSSLTISNTGGVVTLGSNVTVSNNLTIADGTFSLGTFTANRATSGGTLAVANGATLKIGGTNPLPANYATHSLAASSTIEYGGSAQNVSAESYGNLTLSGSGTKTLLSGSTAIAGNLTIGSGTTFAAGANNFSLAGNWSNNGVGFTFSGTQTVTFNGASPQSIDGSSSTTFNDVAINSGSVLNLAFSGSDAAQVLKIAGVNKAAGTWGATGSSATHVDDAHFQGTTGVLSIATGPASATSVATSGTPSIYGTPVTLTATVTGTGPTPSGTVTFMDGLNTLGVGTLDGSARATFATNRLSATSHSITAVYGGDGNFAGSTSTALSQVINAATLTVSGITASNKVYDGNSTAAVDVSNAALVGVVAGDVVRLNTGGGAGVFANQNAGPANTVQVSGMTISGADIGNYTLTQPTTTASISAYPMTVTAATNTKTYDAGATAAATPSMTLGTLQGTDTAILSETYDSKNAGTGKTLTPAAAINDGNGGNNYTVTLVPDTTGEITKHSLTVTATGVNKPYDGTVAATVTLTDDHLGGDSVSDSYTSASFASADVGNSKVVTVTDISIAGIDAGNYELTSTTAGTTANITPASLSVVADDKSRPYGQDNPPLTKHYTGFVNNENEGVLTGSPDLSTTALTNSVPGSYPISVTNGTLSAVNYTFNFVDGTLTIGKVLLTVTADDQSRPYGATNPVFTVTYTGFLNGDDTNALSGLPDVTTDADTNSVVADSPFTISVTNGTLIATNYDFAFVSGSLTVTPAVVTITADSQSKVYGAAVPTLTASYTGFVNGEGTNVLSGAPDLSTTASTTSSVADSPYTIAVTNGTLSAGNYNFTFVDGALTVTPATVTASVSSSDKVYDGTIVATIVSNALSGVIGTDDVSLIVGSANFDDKNVGSHKTVTANGLALGGADDGNYSLALPTASTTANITLATLTVKADDQTRAYGAANPAVTASYSGFATGEVLATSGVTGSPSLTTAATPTSPVFGSPYTITAAIGSLAANNYTFSVLGGLLTVTPADASAAVISSLNPSCSGVGVNFTATVTASGAGTPTGTVQFKIDGGDLGSPVPLSGNSATSGNTSTLTAGGHTITAVYSGDGNFNGTTSPDYTQTVNALLAAPTASNDGPVCVGATLHLSTSTVTGATYSWTGPNGFVSTDQNPTISNVTTDAAGTYGVTVTVNGCASAAGTTSVTINSAPSISGQPSGATKCVGDSITFSVSASGDGLTYQWRKGGANITDTTASSYTIPAISAGDAGSYDCVVSGTCSPPATSDAANLVVSPTAVAGTASAAPASVCRGDATTVTLSGYTGSIQWQSSTDNVVYANISGETNATVSTGPLVATTYFQAVVSSSPCAAVTSTVASVSISTNAPSISYQPAGVAVCENGVATFSVTASGNGPLGYAWRKRSIGWSSGWTLNSGGGGFFTFTSTGNDNFQAASNAGNDIDTAGRAWGMYNSGDDVTEALRPFPAALGVGQTFSIDMDNDSVYGTVGFGLQDSNTGSNRLEVYFVGGRDNYTINDATGEHDSGVPFTWAGINVLVRLTSSNACAVTITRYIDGQTVSFAGALSNAGTVDRLRLFDANGHGDSPYDLYFNNVRVGSVDDNAADVAYDSGWNNGSNGGQMPLVNGGDIANADTDTLTVSPSAPADGGSYDVSISDACGLVTISSAATLTVNPPPATFNVTGGGAYCSGGSGVPVGLDGSQLGVSYVLLHSAESAGSPVDGTGSAITFGNQTTAGIYSIIATNTNTGCTATMTGSATVTVNQTPTMFNVTGGGAYCADGSGVAVGLDGSQSGVNYQLQVDNFDNGSPVAGTGDTISFGNQTAAGTYTVVASDATTGCTTIMTGSTMVTINPMPTAFTMTGGGAYCTGGSGVAVGLSGSQSGVNYQLQLNGSPLGSPVAGTGSALSFGNQTVAGSYTVVATDATTGCATTMTGSATVIVNALPAEFNVTGGGSYNQGGSGVPVGLDGSQVGVNYQLQLNSSNTDSPVAGTGNALSFGNQTAAGTYTVMATDASTGCTISMVGSATVTVIPLTAFEQWQLQYFGCTNCPQASATADPDGDGQNNMAEFLAGTDPTNSVSVLRITSITRQGVNILITWTTAGGRTNALQAVNGNPGSTNFADVSDPIIVTGSGDTSTNYVDVGGATNAPARFYRVRLVP